MLVQCWPSVCDAVPALPQHWTNVSCYMSIPCHECVISIFPQIDRLPSGGCLGIHHTSKHTLDTGPTLVQPLMPHFLSSFPNNFMISSVITSWFLQSKQFINFVLQTLAQPSTSTGSMLQVCLLGVISFNYCTRGFIAFLIDSFFLLFTTDCYLIHSHKLLFDFCFVIEE